MLLADWLCTNTQCDHPAGSAARGFEFDFRKKTVVELGAGVGVPSLVLAKLAIADVTNRPSGEHVHAHIHAHACTHVHVRVPARLASGHPYPSL